METIQLRFLRMLSEHGSQNITFNCRNTLIDLSNHEIKLRTKNGMIYQIYSFNDDSLRYNIIKDECKVILIRCCYFIFFVQFLLVSSWSNNSIHCYK
jgi:ABC-type polar amino acid transport system ATPase subunit